MLPSFSTFKLNVIIRYLERSGTIIIDNEGYVVWTRQDKEKDALTLADVANISNDFQDYLKKFHPGKDN